eukprot:gene19731-26423_t
MGLAWSASDIEAREERIKQWFQEQHYQMQQHYEKQFEMLKSQNSELLKTVIKLDSRCKALQRDVQNMMNMSLREMCKQIVSVDLNRASKTTPGHFFDSTDLVNGKQPLVINWEYDVGNDQLSVFFTATTPELQMVKTDDPRIFIGTCNDALLQSLHIKEASKSIYQLNKQLQAS